MDLWETQEAEESARNWMWEELNAPQNEPEKEEPEYNLYSAVDQLHDGLDALDEAIKYVQNAIDDAEGHPISGKLGGSLINLKNVDEWLKKLEKEIHEELIRKEGASA